MPSRHYRPYKEDGARLRRARKRLDLDVQAIAEAIHCEASTVYAVEYGARPAREEHIVFLYNESRRRGNSYPAIGQELVEAFRRGCKVCVVFGGVPEFGRETKGIA